MSPPRPRLSSRVVALTFLEHRTLSKSGVIKTRPNLQHKNTVGFHIWIGCTYFQASASACLTLPLPIFLSPRPCPISCTFFWIKILIDLLSTYNYFTVIFFLSYICFDFERDYSAHYFQNSNPVPSPVLLWWKLHFVFWEFFFLPLSLCMWSFECDFSQFKPRICWMLNIYRKLCEVLEKRPESKRPGSCTSALWFSRRTLALGIDLIIIYSRLIVENWEYKCVTSEGNSQVGNIMVQSTVWGLSSLDSNPSSDSSLAVWFWTRYWTALLF